jgi:hypothetical protein
MINKSSASCSNQLSYCGYPQAGLEPTTLTSLNEVVLIYGTLFIFNILKRRVIGNKCLLTLRSNRLNYPFGAGLKPTFQLGFRSNTYKRHLPYKEQRAACVNFHFERSNARQTASLFFKCGDVSLPAWL